MNVKELIAELQKLDGDLMVVVDADHGQTPMTVTWAGKGAVEDSTEYMMEHTDTDADGELVALIQAY